MFERGDLIGEIVIERKGFINENFDGVAAFSSVMNGYLREYILINDLKGMAFYKQAIVEVVPKVQLPGLNAGTRWKEFLLMKFSMPLDYFCYNLVLLYLLCNLPVFVHL